ncbi:MAG: SxtJ family membrane protein [Pseudorhodoplanes sp.]
MSTAETTQSYREVKRGSNRNFGLVFAFVFAVIALLPLWHGGAIRLWAAAIGGLFAIVAFVAPALLDPLNRLWYRFGLLLHHVMNPLIMGLMFFGAFTPMGLVLRAMGKDLLRLKRDPDAKSYWIARDPPGPRTGSMSKQF